MKSKRFEVLANRPVNQDGFVKEWPEVGLMAMNSPYDPKPSIRVLNGKVVELDGKERKDFDFNDRFLTCLTMGIVIFSFASQKKCSQKKPSTLTPSFCEAWKDGRFRREYFFSEGITNCITFLQSGLKSFLQFAPSVHSDILQCLH